MESSRTPLGTSKPDFQFVTEICFNCILVTAVEEIEYNVFLINPLRIILERLKVKFILHRQSVIKRQHAVLRLGTPTLQTYIQK